MHIRRLLPLLILAATWLGVVVATGGHEHGPGDVNISRKVRFTEVDDDPVFLDVAWPTREGGPYPIVVFLHGGAWIREGAAFREEIVDAARRDYVAVRVNYRLLERDADGKVRHRFPAQLEDVRQALVWLSAHRDEFGADMERVALVGASAGGHLALLAGLPDSTLQADATSQVAVRVKAIVDLYGPVDLAEAWNVRPRQRPLLESLLGGTPAENPQAYRDASPIHLPNHRSPPVLILHGKLDGRVPLQQSERLARKLHNAGVEHKLVVFDDQRHSFTAAALKEVDNLMYQFLEHLAVDVPSIAAR